MASESTLPNGAQSPAKRRHTADIRRAEGTVSDQLSAPEVTSTRPCNRGRILLAERRAVRHGSSESRGPGIIPHSAKSILAGIRVQPLKIPATACGQSNLNATNPYPQSPSKTKGPRARKASRRKSAHQIGVRSSSVNIRPPRVPVSLWLLPTAI